MANQNPSRHAPEEIDAYLAPLSEPVRASLERLRRMVRQVAPGVTERVGYGIPIFRLGRDLVGMSARTGHCSLHTMSAALPKVMADELRGVEVSGSTIHFTPDRPLPEELIVRIVQARIRENEGR